MFGGGLAALAIALLLWQSREIPGGDSTPFEPPSRLVEPAPPCSWRDPDLDSPRVFPEGNRRQTETRILSGLRGGLSKQLGRGLYPEENALTLHRVYQDLQPLGAVLVRRVKGQHGAIEVVLAVTETGRVRRVWLQRLREPPAIADAVQNANWLATFQGRTHEQGWEIDDLRSLPEDARISGQAIREGIRSVMILLTASAGSGAHATSEVHN